MTRLTEQEQDIDEAVDKVSFANSERHSGHVAVAPDADHEKFEPGQVLHQSAQLDDDI